MSPAHHTGQRRWIVLAAVVAVIAGLEVAAHSPATRPVGGPKPAPGAAVGAPDAESSAWYCTGQTTTAGQLAPGSVMLTNTSTRKVSGTIQAVTETGAKVETAISVPARGQLVANVPAPKSGTWLSEAVMLSGGGVAVSQVIHGASAWTEAPCQSSTSQHWFFPSGATTGSNAMFLALFNPTSTADVIDMGFVTPKGVTHPINFQGIVLQPDETKVESVGPFVQDQPSIATTVSTRTGRLVASELQVLTGAGSGLAIIPGSPHAENEWTIPQSVEVSGGTSSIDVFNPGRAAENVTVHARLASGPLSPFMARVPPDTTWVLSTSAQTRIPQGDPYSAVIEGSGGTGVVVGRVVGAPSSAAAPQQGSANAVDVLTTATPGRSWVVPSPEAANTSAIVGAVPVHLAVTNTAVGPEKYVVEVMKPSGTRTIASGTLAGSASVLLGEAILSRAGSSPIIVRASGPAAVSEDVGPSGTLGVVTMPGIPLSLALNR